MQKVGKFCHGMPAVDGEFGSKTGVGSARGARLNCPRKLPKFVAVP